MANELQKLQVLFNRHEVASLKFNGHCHDCGGKMAVQVDMGEDGKTTMDGGFLYIPNEPDSGKDEERFLKCDECFGKDPILRNYKECEVYSRIVGYLRPVSQWNDGKQSEFKTRVNYKVGKERR